eukprot:1176351-Prorocentrum_minimum.AAC.6
MSFQGTLFAGFMKLAGKSNENRTVIMSWRIITVKNATLRSALDSATKGRRERAKVYWVTRGLTVILLDKRGAAVVIICACTLHSELSARNSASM